MAGAGYKLFATGDVLTAAEVNTYLQQQVTMVFANSTARTTALSGVLAEGMMSYLQDTNTVEVYNGSNWVNVGNTGDVTEVQAGTGISVADGTGPIPIVTNTMATEIDAKGDLIVGTGADTFDRLAVGTDGYTLVADSTETTGLKWVAPAAGGGMTLLSTTTLSGTSTTISGISTAYKNLQIVVQLVSLSNAGTYNIQPNASATNCVFVGQYFFGPSTTGVSSSAGGAPAQSSNFLTGNTDNSFSMNIYDYASASNRKSFDFQGYYFNASNVYCAEQAHGGVKTTSAITSLKLEASLGYSFNGGTVLLYGVS